MVTFRLIQLQLEFFNCLIFEKRLRACLYQSFIQMWMSSRIGLKHVIRWDFPQGNQRFCEVLYEPLQVVPHSLDFVGQVCDSFYPAEYLSRSHFRELMN